MLKIDGLPFRSYEGKKSANQYPEPRGRDGCGDVSRVPWEKLTNKGNTMSAARNLSVALTLGLTGLFGITGANAADPNGRRVVTVAFGAGLNTAQPGNPKNHHVVPREIQVEAGDVINFVVGGLHIIRAYEDGVRPGQIRDQIPDECEVNPVPSAADAPQCYFGNTASPVAVIPTFDLPVYYEGINPLAAPPPAPPFAQASAAVNRVESVSFLKTGRFLVICAVLPHFNDRMTAWVEVLPRGSLNSETAE
jgi:hypothetical protein